MSLNLAGLNNLARFDYTPRDRKTVTKFVSPYIYIYIYIYIYMQKRVLAVNGRRNKLQTFQSTFIISSADRDVLKRRLILEPLRYTSIKGDVHLN